jgi:hypothetical protein
MAAICFELGCGVSKQTVPAILYGVLQSSVFFYRTVRAWIGTSFISRILFLHSTAFLGGKITLRGEATVLGGVLLSP